MEYTHKRDDDQEVMDQENTVISLGILGRSYECVFCKRGFTTAQALGGHMNIHRRDRGKTRANTNKQHDDQEEMNYAGPRFYQPQKNFSASASSPRSKEYDNWSCGGLSFGCSINPFEVDWRMRSLSFKFGGSEDLMVIDKRRGGSEDVLDLELRLGYQPR